MGRNTILRFSVRIYGDCLTRSFFSANIFNQSNFIAFNFIYLVVQTKLR